MEEFDYDQAGAYPLVSWLSEGASDLARLSLVYASCSDSVGRSRIVGFTESC